MTEQSLLLTDLYELSMLEAYAAHGMAETAVFELFVRKLPSGRGFLMAAVDLTDRKVVVFLWSCRWADRRTLRPSLTRWVYDLRI
jgi:Nicotinate phosphoribosyltransferase (NAPRTase) N-terminal domain